MKSLQLITAYFSFISIALSVKPCLSNFTAAVYEHVPFFVIENKTELTRSGALEIMKKNLAVYQTKAVLAKSKDAQIIVFPEDGLYGFLYNREQIFPFLEIIPDPSTLEKSWNPCTDPDRFINTEVLRELSCIAHNSSIAVVANMGDVQYCDKSSDPHCPEDGRYQFNTDVVFDTDGTLLAKYHKQHLYHEDQFNTPQKAEIVIFKTSFGVKFGVFTCFDMLFYDPAIELVQKFGVRNIVFPTAWINGFPILASVEYQQGWSRLTCVNLLAANQHLPLVDMAGSGIYSCGEALSYVYDMKTYEGHLLVASLPNLEMHTELPIQHETCQSNKVPFNLQQHDIKQEESPFHSKLMNDIYTFVKIDGSQGNASVCANGLCCHASYILPSQQPLDNELFALGAFNGHHDPEGYIIQACVLIKCNSMAKDSCGTPTQTSSTIFNSFQLMGNFSAKAYVFPEVLASDVELIPAKAMAISGNVMSVNVFEKPLLSAVLFGRIYELDNVKN